jgi:hypothetical protein
VAAMNKAFAPSPKPSTRHDWLAAQPKRRLLVNVWYDDLPQKAFLKTQGLRPPAGRQPSRAFRRMGSLVFLFNRPGFRAMLR